LGFELSNHREHIEQHPADRIGGVVHRPAQIETNLARGELVGDGPGKIQAYRRGDDSCRTDH
jgi:hypothetical protein